MKKQITITALLLLFAGAALAATYSLTWNASTSADVTGYRVYSATNSAGPWKLEKVTGPLGGSGTSLPNVSDGVNFIGVTATNLSGSESDKAVGEILSPPTGLKIIKQ